MQCARTFLPNLFLLEIFVIRFCSRIICSPRSGKIHLFQTPISTRLRLSLFEISSCTNSRLSRQILEIVFYTNTRRRPLRRHRKRERERERNREGEREREIERWRMLWCKCTATDEP